MFKVRMWWWPLLYLSWELKTPTSQSSTVFHLGSSMGMCNLFVILLIHLQALLAMWPSVCRLRDPPPPKSCKVHLFSCRSWRELPLLQWHANEHGQQPAPSALIFNISVLQEVISAFHPPVIARPPSPPHSVATTAGVTDHDLLLPASAMPGAHLSLQEFCTRYSLSNAIHQKLDENGYTGSNTITYICVSEMKEMGFKFGEVAAMKDAIQQWAV